jgi:type I restriction enzyme, S subunit
LRCANPDEVRSANHRFYSGQILYSKIRPNLAKVVIVNFDGLCSAYMYPINAHIYPKYLLKYMLSPTFLSMAVRTDTRVAMPKINQTELNKILVAVPPLAEQQRIVEKCDRLMSLCDTLEIKLKQGRDSSEKLIEVAAKQVLTA